MNAIYIILRHLGFLCIRDAGRRGKKITVNEMKVVKINENIIYYINSINIIISYNFEEGHDTF